MSEKLELLLTKNNVSSDTLPLLLTSLQRSADAAALRLTNKLPLSKLQNTLEGLYVQSKHLEMSMLTRAGTSWLIGLFSITFHFAGLKPFIWRTQPSLTETDSLCLCSRSKLENLYKWLIRNQQRTSILRTRNLRRTLPWDNMTQNSGCSSRDNCK